MDSTSFVSPDVCHYQVSFPDGAYDGDVIRIIMTDIDQYARIYILVGDSL